MSTADALSSALLQDDDDSDDENSADVEASTPVVPIQTAAPVSNPPDEANSLPVVAPIAQQPTAAPDSSAPFLLKRQPVSPSSFMTVAAAAAAKHAARNPVSSAVDAAQGRGHFPGTFSPSLSSSQGNSGGSVAGIASPPPVSTSTTFSGSSIPESFVSAPAAAAAAPTAPVYVAGATALPSTIQTMSVSAPTSAPMTAAPMAAAPMTVAAPTAAAPMAVAAAAAAQASAASAAHAAEQRQQQNEMIRNCIKLMFQRVAGDPEKFNQLRQAIRDIQQAKQNPAPGVPPPRMPRDLFKLVEPIVGREVLKSCLNQVKEEFRASRLPPPTQEELEQRLEKQCVEGEQEMAAAVQKQLQNLPPHQQQQLQQQQQQQQLQQQQQHAAGGAQAAATAVSNGLSIGGVAGAAMRSFLEDFTTTNGSNRTSFQVGEAEGYARSLERAWVEAGAVGQAVDADALMFPPQQTGSWSGGGDHHPFPSAAAHTYPDPGADRFFSSLSSPPASLPLHPFPSSSSTAPSSSSSSSPSPSSFSLAGGSADWLHALNRTECAMRLKRTAHDAGLRLTLSAPPPPPVSSPASPSSSSPSAGAAAVVTHGGLPDDRDCALFLSCAVQAYLSTAVVPGLLRCASQRRSLTAKKCGDLVEWTITAAAAEDEDDNEVQDGGVVAASEKDDDDDEEEVQPASRSKRSRSPVREDGDASVECGNGHSEHIDGSNQARVAKRLKAGKEARDSSDRPQSLEAHVSADHISDSSSSFSSSNKSSVQRTGEAHTLPLLESSAAEEGLDPVRATRLPSSIGLCSHDVLLYLDLQCSPPYMCPGIQACRHSRPPLSTSSNNMTSVVGPLTGTSTITALPRVASTPSSSSSSNPPPQEQSS